MYDTIQETHCTLRAVTHLELRAPQMYVFKSIVFVVPEITMYLSCRMYIKRI